MNQWKEYIERYDTVFAFLGLELLSLIFFGLGGATGSLIIRLIGFFVAVAMFPFIRINYSDKQLKTFALELIPLALVALFGGFSAFTLSANGGGFAGVFSSMVMDATITLGALGFFLLAVALKHNKTVKMDWILLAIGGSLGLLVLITTLYSLARYGFFYSAIYAGKYYYWDGSRFPLSTEGKVLYGFEFLEASLNFSCFSAFILSCALPAALFVSPKKDVRRFSILLAFGLLGLLSLVLIPFKRALYILIPVYLVALLIRFLKPQKEAPRYLVILGRVLASLVVVALLVLFADALAPTSFLSKIPFVGRYFATGDKFMINGRYFKTSLFGEIENQIYLTFYKSGNSLDILSILFGNYFRLGNNGLRLKSPTSGLYLADFLSDTFEFNYLFQSGLLGFIALIIVIFQGFIWSYRYLNNEEGERYQKVIPVLMLLGAFIYLSLFSDEMPFAHTSSYSFVPLIKESRLYCLFFLLGMIFTPKNKPVVESAPVEESEPEPKTLQSIELEEVKLDEE